MRILIRGLSPMKGGTETFVLNYCRGLISYGHSVDFLVWSETTYMEQYKDLKSRFYYVTARHKNVRKYKKELQEFFENHAGEYDVFWDNMNLISNIDYLKMAEKYGIRKIIAHGHSTGSEAGVVKRLLHQYNKSIIRKYATDLWCCSDDAGRFSFGITKAGIDYKIINNAICTEKFIFQQVLRLELRRQYGVDNKYVIGNIGRLSMEKYPSFMLQVYEECRKLMPDTAFCLVGGGILEEEMKRQVEERQIQDVYFLGHQDDPAMFYNMFDIFIMPSLFEGFGITAIEAQANGLKCLLSDRIPRDAFVTDLAESLSIGDGDEVRWGKRIAQIRCETVEGRQKGIYKREDNRTIDYVQRIKAAGFDLKTEIPKLERLLHMD